MVLSTGRLVLIDLANVAEQGQLGTSRGLIAFATGAWISVHSLVVVPMGLSWHGGDLP
jgi:hypothetical protein